jgi:hypothetical protein
LKAGKEKRFIELKKSKQPEGMHQLNVFDAGGTKPLLKPASKGNAPFHTMTGHRVCDNQSFFRPGIAE